MAVNIIKKYDSTLINGVPRAIPIENIMEQHGLNIEYQYIRNNGRILGVFLSDGGVTGIYDKTVKQYGLVRFEEKTVIIDGTLADDKNNGGRIRFTLGHEFAHYVLDKNTQAGVAVAHIENCDCRAERAVDYLSSALLMPMGQVKKCFYGLRSTNRNEDALISRMAQIFDVSKQAMKIRLAGHNLI